MIELTNKAVEKVQEILNSQEPKPAGLRIAVVGGGGAGRFVSISASCCLTDPVCGE